MDSHKNLPIYHSSEEEEGKIDPMAEEGPRKRPNLNQFLDEFELGMRSFNDQYQVSKS